MDDLLSPMHIIVLLIVVLVIFGPKRLPELGSNLAKTIKEFKHAMNDDTPANGAVVVKSESQEPQQPQQTPGNPPQN
jgi:sec-independent protein translocase protein TatA